MSYKLQRVPPPRLLRCFCGCTELTETEVKHVYRLNVRETLINKMAALMFRKFVEQHRSGDKSEAEQYLDVYEHCDNFLKRTDSETLTLDELDELADLGLPYDLEVDLKSQIMTGDCLKIERCLMRIQGRMCDEIELHHLYADYKQAILDKLKGRIP